MVRELAELHKANASRASEAEEAALSRETRAKEQLSLALEKAQEEARMQQEALASQVTHARTVKTHHRKLLQALKAHQTSWIVAIRGTQHISNKLMQLVQSVLF